MAKYRKKPVVIEAVPLVEGCYNDIVALTGQEPGDLYGYIMGTTHPMMDKPTGLHSSTKTRGFEMWIKTLEGTLTASYGDYIIKGVAGEIYPCKPDIFLQTYEPVDNG